MKESVSYRNGILKITFPDYGKDGRNYGELFDFLGDFDIITASELGQDVIVMSDTVFMFTNSDEGQLARNSYIELGQVCFLKDFIEPANAVHTDFLKWYKN
ncbi:MAG: hypothetical protein LCH67_01495 [Bacteroidetes bacterium]|nr:hypothetical protein [Bacteroidota bacterium]